MGNNVLLNRILSKNWKHLKAQFSLSGLHKRKDERVSELFPHLAQTSLPDAKSPKSVSQDRGIPQGLQGTPKNRATLFGAPIIAVYLGVPYLGKPSCLQTSTRGLRLKLATVSRKFALLVTGRRRARTGTVRVYKTVI